MTAGPAFPTYLARFRSMLADQSPYQVVLLEFGLIFVIVVLAIGLFLARRMAQTSVIVGMMAGTLVLVGGYFIIKIVFGADLLNAKVTASPATYALMIGIFFTVLLAYAFAGPTPLSKSVNHAFMGGPFAITVISVLGGLLLWTGLESLFNAGDVNLDMTRMNAGPFVGDYGSYSPSDYAHIVAVVFSVPLWLLLLNRWGAKRPEFDKTAALLSQLGNPAYKMRAALSHPTIGPTTPPLDSGPLKVSLPPEFASASPSQAPESYLPTVAPSVAQPLPNSGPWTYELPLTSRFWKLDRILPTINKEAAQEDVMLSARVRLRGHYGAQLLHVTENHLLLHSPRSIIDIPRGLVRNINNNGIGSFPINIRLSNGDTFEIGAVGAVDYNPNPSFGLFGGFGRGGRAADQDDLAYSLQSMFGFITAQQDIIQRPTPSF